MPSSILPRLTALASLGLALTACHRTPLKVERQAPGVDGGGSNQGSDARGDAPGGTFDAGADVRGRDPAFEQFLRELDDALGEVWSRCFNTPSGLSRQDDLSQSPAAFLDASVPLGLIVLDAAAAERCFEALRMAPCDRIADLSVHGLLGPARDGLAGCADVFVGQVTPGHSCLLNEDCQSPAQYGCAPGGLCGGVCTARIARESGAPCNDDTDACPEGTVCRFGPRNINEQRCIALIPEGGACREDAECAAGLHCAERTATSIGDGTCRPTAPGGSCKGNWDCAFPYVCGGVVGPGICQVGKTVGTPCATFMRDVNGNVYSDCAPFTQCLDVDGSGARCVDGVPLGARCGVLAGNPPGWLGCREGYCATAPGGSPMGTCQPKKGTGEPCDGDLQCAGADHCVIVAGSAVCGPLNVPAPLGSSCSVISSSDCGAGEYCAWPADFDERGPSIPTMGACAPVIPAGKPCRSSIDKCEELSSCVNGVCTRCP